jgi:drug/metabolite transporter (DMT)-like permease
LARPPANGYQECVMPSVLETWLARLAPGLFVILWSSGFIGAKYGLPYAEPFTYLSVRMGLGLALFAVIVAVSRPLWPPVSLLLNSAVVGLLAQGVYLGGVFVSIHLGLPAGLSALISGLQPVLTSTLATRWLGERVGLLQWAGLALGAIGVYLVVEGRLAMGGTQPGAWVAIVAALIGITVGTLYQKRYCARVDLRISMLVQLAASCLLFVPAAFLFETRAISWTADFIFAVAWMVLVLSFGANLLLFWLIRRSAATRVASLFYLTPSVTALMAWILFGEHLDTLSLIGMGVCAIAVLLVNVRQSATGVRQAAK